MEVKHGLGYQNYEKIMRNHIFYIDKTDFIKQWWDYADEVTLITRPRRFGKTLNMSTIECFFSNCYAVKKDMTDETAATSISILSMYLEKYYQKKVMILLDEYDTPMQEAWIYGYWEEAVAFFRSFFVNTFKDNESMERGLITGITRISKESIF